MDTITQLAASYYPDLEDNELRRICRATIAYLLKTAYDSRKASSNLSNVIKTVGGDRVGSTREYRRDIYIDGYIIKNLKLWLWWISSKGLKPKQSHECMSEFKVKKHDWPLAKLTMTDKPLLARVRKMAKLYDAHSMVDFDAMVQSAVDAADNAIRSRVRTKLRFLEMTRFITSDDLLGELRYSAVLGLTRHYPKIESEEHARNLAGLCARNGGDSIINDNTKEGNKFLTQNEDSTWDSIILSYDNSEMDDSIPASDTFDIQEERSASDDTDVNDNLSAIGAEMLASRYTGNRRTFVTLMLGIENEGFSEYLGEFGLPANHVMYDEAAASARKTDLFKRYVKHAASWLGVSEKAAWDFLNELGDMLK